MKHIVLPRILRIGAAEKWQELKGEPAPSGFANVRVHDLKHTFGHRLEAAGTAFGDCQVLLGHRPRTVTQRYMVAEMVRLIEAADRVLETERRTTVPLTIIRSFAAKQPRISRVERKWHKSGTKRKAPVTRLFE